MSFMLYTYVEEPRTGVSYGYAGWKDLGEIKDTYAKARSGSDEEPKKNVLVRRLCKRYKKLLRQEPKRNPLDCTILS